MGGTDADSVPGASLAGQTGGSGSGCRVSAGKIIPSPSSPTVAGTTISSDWEVFASILVKDLGQKLAAGIDLSNYEVKSAAAGGSYEYQYHKNTGKTKLATDMKTGHLFFEHANNLQVVHLRFAHGSQMKEFFSKWLDKYPDPYPQRYRKPYQWVKKNATLLMTLTDGEVTFPQPKPVMQAQSEDPSHGSPAREEV